MKRKIEDRKIHERKIKRVFIFLLAIFFVLAGIRMAPGVGYFVSFNMELDEFLAEASTSAESDKVMISKSEMVSFETDVSDFAGVIIQGQKFILQNPTSLLEMRAIVDSSSVYIYTSKNEKYEKMKALCFQSPEDSIALCIAALQNGHAD